MEFGFDVNAMVGPVPVTGSTTAKVTLTNNSLRPYSGTSRIAVLMDETEEPLERQIIDAASTLNGETSNIQTVTLDQKGQRVLVYPFSVEDMLRLEGLPITAEDFASDGNGNFTLTYRIKESGGTATRLLITACSNGGGSLNGTPLSGAVSTGGNRAASVEFSAQR